jgi:hypothetical protein
MFDLVNLSCDRKHRRAASLPCEHHRKFSCIHRHHLFDRLRIGNFGCAAEKSMIALTLLQGAVHK